MNGMDTCTVRGNLTIVLRVSSALGLAPLRLARVRGGYKATISQSTAIYGCILTFCIHLGIIIATYIMYINAYESGTSFPFGDFLIKLLVMIITAIGSYGSIGRMRRMIKLLVLFYKIKYDINGNLKVKQNIKILVTISSYIILYSALLTSSQYVTFLRKNLLAEVFNTIFDIEHFKMLLLEMESVLINFDVRCVLREISKKLRELKDETNSGNVSPATSRLTSKRIQDLSKSYVAICDLVMRLSADRGLILYTHFSSTILCLMFTICNLIDSLTLFPEGNLKNTLVCIQLLWCGVHLFRIVLFVEPWHQIQEEVTEIRILLTQIMYNVTPIGESIPLQLDLMFKHLLLNEPTMSPLHMFTFQRSLLITAVGFVTTYLVMLLQFLKNRWNK